MSRRRKVFIDTLKKSRGAGLVFCLSVCISAIVFYLYRLPLEPFFYAVLLIVFLLLILFFVSFFRNLGKAEKREQMKREVMTGFSLLPADTLAEADYSEMISLLRIEAAKLREEFHSARQDDADYYTAWAHQIKTPIAVMRMELGNGENESSRKLDAELFRIEQYVDMVLTYIRLDGGKDLVIREYPLDELIREAIRKFAPQFVYKKLRLSYESVPGMLVTDKKWFSCILEQFLSNAVKYTQAGEIRISMNGDLLMISDTGIGIAPEDLPRIFEKGFTGENGRIEKRSSGLGLYLCKKAADLLNIPLSAESKVGKGSTFSLDLTNKRRF